MELHPSSLALPSGQQLAPVKGPHGEKLGEVGVHLQLWEGGLLSA